MQIVPRATTDYRPVRQVEEVFGEKGSSRRYRKLRRKIGVGLINLTLHSEIMQIVV